MDMKPVLSLRANNYLDSPTHKVYNLCRNRLHKNRYTIFWRRRTCISFYKGSWERNKRFNGGLKWMM